jgi:hypothetical protein
MAVLTSSLPAFSHFPAFSLLSSPSHTFSRGIKLEQQYYCALMLSMDVKSMELILVGVCCAVII